VSPVNIRLAARPCETLPFNSFTLLEVDVAASVHRGEMFEAPEAGVIPPSGILLLPPASAVRQSPVGGEMERTIRCSFDGHTHDGSWRCALTCAPLPSQQKLHNKQEVLLSYCNAL
jgi:hypothetical protein